MANYTTQIPELPSYTLSPRSSLIPGVSDVLTQLLSPVVAYWVVSLLFHILDVYDFWPQYRLHTPAEILKRNHVSRYEVFRDVIVQQLIQTIFGYAIAYFDPVEMVGKEAYDIAVWARRVRVAETHIPRTLAVLGVNAPKLANQIYDSYPTVAAALAGGTYANSSVFASWELTLGKFIYHAGIPALQFIIAILLVDTWQYFIHRAMHMNKFLYVWLHSRHHRLYVPYAYGALYNHPLEGLFLDTLGTGLAYLVTGMTVRQGLVFFTCSTIKTVDDHCGYKFPWDPLQHITSNNAAYHDIHHQSWGIKSNFSQPFFTFWDRFLGTTWTGGDVSARYERDRIKAQKKVDADLSDLASSVTNSPATDLPNAEAQAKKSQRSVLETDGAQVLREERREEQEAKKSVRRTTQRRKTGSFDPRSTLASTVPSLHGRSTPILHADGVH
ncbi:Sphingolipid C4-hydroxylase sur2 [Knufia obscura]|uniref:Sphingolipid C4-hydroxylase sur2 n=2 Tax=Knufia TaxID=430999 RepID=A0AAN8I2N9_9EURO|nr:Sphingolipid C4-hydroxylase sur2 [Knufia obscura]KAK5949039.1 Sphingolipid C4-hydroxylase sur2 [Knufia fluminis]